MKQLLLVALLLAPAAAMAQTPLPPTIELPVQDWKDADGIVHPGIDSLRKALGSLPYDQVAGFIALIGNCVSVQVPDKSGAIRDSGQCPAVSQAIHARQADAAADKAQIADLNKKLTEKDKPPAVAEAKPEPK